MNSVKPSARSRRARVLADFKVEHVAVELSEEKYLETLDDLAEILYNYFCQSGQRTKLLSRASAELSAGESTHESKPTDVLKKECA